MAARPPVDRSAPPASGEIRLYRIGRPDKERPVLILTRSSAIAYLSPVTVGRSRR